MTWTDNLRLPNKKDELLSCLEDWVALYGRVRVLEFKSPSLNPKSEFESPSTSPRMLRNKESKSAFNAIFLKQIHPTSDDASRLSWAICFSRYNNKPWISTKPGGCDKLRYYSKAITGGSAEWMHDREIDNEGIKNGWRLFLLTHFLKIITFSFIGVSTLDNVKW